MSAEVLRIDRHPGLRVLTIDRAHAGNSMSTAVTEAFERAFDDALGDEALRAIVITGAGDRFFCAGGDIKQYRRLVTRGDADAEFARPRALLDRIESLPVPVIAAVNGFALGGGAELMLACDIRLASATARIGFPYVRLGLIPGWDGTERLVRCVGRDRAMVLLATGEPVDATRAAALGLVTEVHPPAQLLDAALALAGRLAQGAPLSLAAIKQVLRAASRDAPDSAREVAARVFSDLWVSEDHREAEAAFAEKRAPVFRGR